VSWKKVLRLANMAVGYNNLGVIVINEENDHEKALPHYEKAAELAPHHDFYKCNVASTVLKLGDEARFEEIIKEVFASNCEIFGRKMLFLSALDDFYLAYAKLKNT